MILLQENLHLLRETIWVLFSLAQLVPDAINFFIKASLDAIEVEVVALVVLGQINLQVPLISCLVVSVLVDQTQDLLLFVFQLAI